MSKKNKPVDYNLRDFSWETEEFKFSPKVNRHKKFIKAKKRQLQKENYADQKRKIDPIIWDEHQRYMSKVEQSILQDYYDRDDSEENFEEYRIK